MLQNLIEKRKLDSHNISSYFPTVEEIRQVVQEEGSQKQNYLTHAAKETAGCYSSDIHDNKYLTSREMIKQA